MTQKDETKKNPVGEYYAIQYFSKSIVMPTLKEWIGLFTKIPHETMLAERKKLLQKNEWSNFMEDLK